MPLIALAVAGGKMNKTLRLFLIFAGIGFVIWWISKSSSSAAATPFGAGAPVAPSVPTNVLHLGLANTPKLTQN